MFNAPLAAAPPMVRSRPVQVLEKPFAALPASEQPAGKFGVSWTPLFEPAQSVGVAPVLYQIVSPLKFDVVEMRTC